MNLLLSTAYLPPISYIQKCRNAETIYLERHEHFIKQSYRNRCYISGPNGKQALIIPVVHENIFRTPIDQVKISYQAKWKNIHWKAICSAYRNAPYFEFYEEELKLLFFEPVELLFEFNLIIIKKIFDFLKIQKPILFTEEYKKDPSPLLDLRSNIHPKINGETILPYQQVFSDKLGFTSDLSVIDYLFNCGNRLP